MKIPTFAFTQSCTEILKKWTNSGRHILSAKDCFHMMPYYISYRVCLCCPIRKPYRLGLRLHDTRYLQFAQQRSAILLHSKCFHSSAWSNILLFVASQNSEKGSRVNRFAFTCLHEKECGTGHIGPLSISQPQRTDFTPQKRHAPYRIIAAPCKRKACVIWQLIRYARIYFGIVLT